MRECGNAYSSPELAYHDAVDGAVHIASTRLATNRPPFINNKAQAERQLEVRLQLLTRTRTDLDSFNLDPASQSRNLLIVPGVHRTVFASSSSVHFGDNYYAPIHGSSVGGQGNTVNITNYHYPVVVLHFASSCPRVT
jgi:hypothetical protein